MCKCASQIVSLKAANLKSSSSCNSPPKPALGSLVTLTFLTVVCQSFLQLGPKEEKIIVTILPHLSHLLPTQFDNAELGYEPQSEHCQSSHPAFMLLANSEHGALFKLCNEELGSVSLCRQASEVHASL